MDAADFSQNSRAGCRHKFNRTVNSKSVAVPIWDGDQRWLDK
jgi:hypothetical protein